MVAAINSHFAVDFCGPQRRGTYFTALKRADPAFASNINQDGAPAKTTAFV
jgi:hypothetical protein